MLTNILKHIFGNRNLRLLKKLNKIVDQINALEDSMKELSDEALAEKTAEFRDRASQGEKAAAILPEAFAVVREVSVRTLGLRHYDVQLLGGMVLNEGKIAEMKTGEGKTLVATLPAYLNAIVGSPVHIVTVNDYLANRDAQWMGSIYAFLGLKVGVIYSGQTPEEKKTAYQCDIVYGTNNEFGFDYLRDNMSFAAENRFQRGLGFAVVDEVDSILIDEARTPLVISGPSEDSVSLYEKINTIVDKLTKQESEDGEGDYSLDEKSKQVNLTDEGHEHAEVILEEAGLLDSGSSLYDVKNISLLHHLYAALRARNLFTKDIDYIVQDNMIVIIDEFTGRMMPGRRWGDGLHQAVEAKEGVRVQEENQTLASITFQNYFRLYKKISGMTGTADTEAPEFLQIYGLEVVVMPTNKEMTRKDLPDLVYRNREEKYTAICRSIEECKKRNQPVLVGTTSIESSEYLSTILKQKNIQHSILNAKQHDKEAQIIAEAGRPGAITIATNMAGRGTDIVLGGNLDLEITDAEDSEKTQIQQEWRKRHDRVLQSGGLHVLGTERNESRRVDNQLRGRCGRQGDPGSSQFYISLEDNLMRIFGSERISTVMNKIGMDQDEAIEHPWVTKAIENAQRKVEGHNFDVRKQLLEYDDVANEQRKLVYQQRNELMEQENISEYIEFIREETVNHVINQSIEPNTLEEQWDVPQLEKDLQHEFGISLAVSQWLEKDDELHEETLREKILQEIIDQAKDKERRAGSENMRHFEKSVMLKVLDEQWKEHLANMNHLRQGIGLRGYAQKDPKQEYKRESFEMFNDFLESVKKEVISILCKVHVPTDEELREMEQKIRQQNNKPDSVEFVHNEPDKPLPPQGATSSNRNKEQNQPLTRADKKVGRNELCPCGSGKKYKQCCGKL